MKVTTRRHSPAHVALPNKGGVYSSRSCDWRLLLGYIQPNV